jgi:hypothetical protein
MAMGVYLNVFNNTLQEVSLPTLLINLIPLFRSLKIILLSPSPPQKSMPYVKCKWKFAKYILQKIFKLVLPLRDCIT